MKKPFIILILFPVIFWSCASTADLYEYSIPADELSSILKLDVKNIKNISDFSITTLADSLPSMHNRMLMSYRTDNKKILDEIIKPAVLEKKDEFLKMTSRQIVNQLSIFAFTTYQQILAKGFYRWGGDILDLDDPQYEGVRHKYKYGLDCSGLSVAGYEIAAYLGLIKGEDLLFSSPGFKHYCETTGFKDGGALNGGSNNYRLDTKELDQLGKEIVRIKRNSTIAEEDVIKLRAGDIVGRNGHFGVIVESNGKLYYLESGGWVVPQTDDRAVEIKQAINKFAQNGYVSVRRCLPD